MQFSSIHLLFNLQQFSSKKASIIYKDEETTMGSESSSRTINLNGRSNKLQPNSNGGKKKSQENIIDRGKRAETNSSSKKTKTNRDNSLHKLLFKDGGLPDGTVVTYYTKKRKGQVIQMPCNIYGPQTRARACEQLYSQKMVKRAATAMAADHFSREEIIHKLEELQVQLYKDCFKPIIDLETGADFIPSMVYGNTIDGQNFKGMYCAMLTIKDSSGMSKVVSAGILRVFGREIAELPLVATRKDYQNKGYFKVLFGCIEKLLASLDVKNLVLPATNEAQSVWTGKFGFQKMPEEKVSEYNKVQ